MKHKIARRLTVYFAAVLLLFSLIAGALFAGIFTRHSAESHAEDLTAHALGIADTISQFCESAAAGECKGGGFNAYFRFIANVAQSDIWLLDRDLHPVQLGDQSSFLTELPADFAPYVHQIFGTQAVCRFSSSRSLNLSDMIIGVPVFSQQGDMLYALLLRHPVSGVTRTYYDALNVLAVCLVCAFALSVVLSVLLSHRFITPIHRMKTATLRMMDGQYDASTGVDQDDELGLLAQHIDQLSIRLLAAQKAQQDMELSRQEFFSNISHELRTPISVLKGSLEVLSEGMIGEPQEQQAYLAQMLQDADHMERLVGDLLELSRLRDSHFSIAMEPINLSDVVQETVRFMRRRASDKGITLSLIGNLVPFRVQGDYGRLRQLLTILLDNAVKFSPEGGEVILTMTQAPHSCTIAVIDHGVGIAGEDLAHIFERFYHRQSPDNRTGSGLGLPIAREIALRHGISIHCDSRLGEGASFTLVFPAHP